MYNSAESGAGKESPGTKEQDACEDVKRPKGRKTSQETSRARALRTAQQKIYRPAPLLSEDHQLIVKL